MVRCGYLILFFLVWDSFSFISAQAENDSETTDGLLCFNEVGISSGIHFRHTDGRHGEKYYSETPGSGLHDLITTTTEIRISILLIVQMYPVETLFFHLLMRCTETMVMGRLLT